MRVPSPSECGLPEKFGKWRPAQQEALNWLLTRPDRIRVKALSAPTGFGKSPVVIAYANLTGLRTCIVTENRGLQDQYMRDFAEIGMVDIRGRRNYECGYREDYTCEEGHAAKCPYKGRVECPASQAEMRASASRLVITNYDKWTSKKYRTFQQVIFDEGHTAPDALARAMQVQLNHREMDDLGVSFPSHSLAEDVVNWKVWANDARSIAEEAYEAAKAQVESTPEPKQSWVRHLNHMQNLVRRLGTILTCNPVNWIADEVERGYQFDPIRPGKQAEAFLLLKVPNITIVSATLRPKTLYMIGIPKASMDYIEFKSDFDPKRCPIYYIPTQFVDVRHPDQSQLWVKLDQIAARRTDRKGIVQTISFARRNLVMAESRFASNMLFNPQGEAATETVELFRNARPGTILVSPSVGAGYDFPGRDCEWQFVCKIPFPDGRSKIVKARQEDDPEYGAYIAINKLVQIFGRGMRSREDQCENFIVDRNVEWFLPKYNHLAPKWFKMFFQQVTTVPPPPPKL